MYTSLSSVQRTDHVLAHLAVVGCGLLELLGAVGSVLGNRPLELALTLAAAGIATLALARSSWQGQRKAWAFLFSLSLVMTICTLFGAAHIQRGLHIPLAAALIVPLWFLLTSIFLGACGTTYADDELA